MSDLLTKEKIGLERISPSAMDAYETCPKLFYYQNWLGLKLEDDRLHMDFGDAIHDSMQGVFLEYDNHFGGAWEAASFDTVKERFLKKWKLSNVPESSFQKFMETKAGKESGFEKKEDLYRYMRNDGLIMLKSYWDNKERFLVENDYDFTEFEVKLFVDMHNPEDPSDKLPIPLSGRIDAINRKKTKMVDFKTSKSMYNETETRKKIQGISYVFGQLMATGKLIEEFDYVIFRKGLKSPDRIELVELKYDMADMLAYYYRVKSILTRIAQREFDRPVSGHQNFCSCYKYDEALSVLGIELPIKEPSM